VSPAERQAIEWDCARLIALYANLNDEHRWEEISALYHPDGLMTRPSDPDVEIRGQQAILAAFQARAPRTTRHICANVVIDVEDERTARGHCAMLLFMDQRPPLVGSFHDRFVRIEGDWKFMERRGSLTFGA
jgi:hypothetical protein